MTTLLVILTTLFVHWQISVFCQSFFLHRYASHHAFELSKRAERWFYLLTYLAQGPSFLVPRAYAALHLDHHRYSDTPDDPHSPRYFSSVWTMMRHTATIYEDYVEGRRDSTHAAQAPVWPALDRLGDSWASRLCWLVLYATLYRVCIDPPAWGYLALVVHALMGPLQGALVNWIGHRHGYRNYPTHDDSRNALMWDVLAAGELFQNNHHRAPSRYDFAHRPFEWDPTALGIRMLSRLRCLVLRPTSSAPRNGIA